ncbi:MAG: DUF86 domain-containing protein [Candidatus Methanoperedens sp.]|nr:DUF86 domain-containing protein [Candidatus Methanoperedens sp.]
MRDDRERIIDILEAIERIEKYTTSGKDGFSHEELIQVWMVHHLQMIGEAARSFSASFREKHNEIPWSKIIGMRNILTHRYFGIDADVVWAVIENDLPELKNKIAVILSEDYI